MNSPCSIENKPGSLNRSGSDVETLDDDYCENACENAPIKVAVLGLSKVGKSSLIASYVYKKSYYFESEHYATIQDTFRFTTEAKGNAVTLEIIEIGGEKDLDDARHRLIEVADAFVLVYSTADRDSFEKIKDTANDIRTTKKKSYFPCVLVANKSDLRSQSCVSKEEGHNLGQQLQAVCLSTSAKRTSYGETAFAALLEKWFSFDSQHFCGYIMKMHRRSKAGMRRAGKLRWFSLEGPTLTWGKRDSAKKILRSLDMKSLEAIEEIDDLAFKLILQDETVLIQAKNAAMKMDWVKSIREVVTQAGVRPRVVHESHDLRDDGS